MFHLGPYHSTFDGGMGDFRKKNVLQTYFRGKKFLQGNTCEENSYNEKNIFQGL